MPCVYLTLCGGTYRWSCGYVIRLKPDDAFEALGEVEWNECTRLHHAMVAGYGDSRPYLEREGYAIEDCVQELDF